MNNTTITKLAINFDNAKKLVNYLIDENLQMSGNIALILIGSRNMYKTILENHIKPGSTVHIFDTKFVNFYLKNFYIKNINIQFVDLKEDNFDDFTIKINNMPKFDYIVQNPPYNGSMHLKFFEAGLNMLKNDGKMVIIEPDTWISQLKENGNYVKENSLAVKLKKRIEGHVSKVVIENYNKEFNITNTSMFSILYIDLSKLYNTISFHNFGEYIEVKSLYDCNRIGKYNTIKSFLSKISNYDNINNHVTNKQLNNDNIYYLLVNPDIVATVSNLYVIRPGFALSDSCYYKTKFGSYFQSFMCPLMQFKRNDISNIIHKAAARGGSSKNHVKLTNNPSTCLFGSKTELENYKYNINNTKIGIFISILFVIDTHGGYVRNYVPWLVDKKYTDQEIYDKFGFNDEEIKLIETTIKKYDRYSPWFKRYLCGPSAVSDEEIQKFIDELENA